MPRRPSGRTSPLYVLAVAIVGLILGTFFVLRLGGRSSVQVVLLPDGRTGLQHVTKEASHQYKLELGKAMNAAAATKSGVAAGAAVAGGKAAEAHYDPGADPKQQAQKPKVLMVKEQPRKVDPSEPADGGADPHSRPGKNETPKDEKLDQRKGGKAGDKPGAGAAAEKAAVGGKVDPQDSGADINDGAGRRRDRDGGAASMSEKEESAADAADGATGRGRRGSAAAAEAEDAPRGRGRGRHGSTREADMVADGGSIGSRGRGGRGEEEDEKRSHGAEGQDPQLPRGQRQGRRDATAAAELADKAEAMEEAASGRGARGRRADDAEGDAAAVEKPADRRGAAAADVEESGDADAATAPRKATIRLRARSKHDPEWLKTHELFAAKAAKARGVLWYGDSRLAPLADGAAAPAEDLQDAWAAAFGGDATENVLAIDDDKMSNLLWRLQQGELPGSLASPRAVVLLAGDADLRAARASAIDQAEDIAARIKDILTYIRTELPDTDVILPALLPAGPRGRPPDRTWPNDEGKARAIVNAELLAASQADRKVHFRDCTDHFLREDRIDESLLPDNFHLSPKGVESLGKCLAKLIAKHSSATH